MAQYLLFIPGILAALTVHEYAHGWMALKRGDTTARDMGRLTLNPIAHLDPVGTVLLFLVHFGWAKPVPVNPWNLRNPRRDMVLVSLAGPASNVLLALLLGIGLQVFLTLDWVDYYSPGFLMMSFAVFINLALAFFNLIPIPPLDGSKIVEGLLPREYLPAWERFERFGWIIIIGIVMLGWVANIHIFGSTIIPVTRGVFALFTGMISPF